METIPNVGFRESDLYFNRISNTHVMGIDPSPISAQVIQRFESRLPEAQAWTERLLHLRRQHSGKATKDLSHAMELVRHLGLGPSDSVAQAVKSEFGRRGFKVVRSRAAMQVTVFPPAAGNPLLMAAHAWRELQTCLDQLCCDIEKHLPRSPGDAGDQLDEVAARIQTLHQRLAIPVLKAKPKPKTAASTAHIPKVLPKGRTPKSMKPRRPISLVGRPLQGGLPSLGKHAR